MKLVNFGVGEISDRLSILALKILFGQEAGKDVSHFEKEWAVLLTQITARTLNARCFEDVLKLAAVNAAIWHAEDDLRQMRTDGGGVGIFEDAGHLGFRLQELNDRRAELIEAINKEAGDHIGAEK